jgi:hypothetical protein
MRPNCSKLAMFVAIIAAASSLLFPSVASAQSTDAASLLALHHSYVGWQFGDGTFTSLRETGNVVNTSPTGGATPRPPSPISTLVRGVVFRDTQVDPDSGRRTDDGFTGHVFWQSNDNGFTHPVIGDEQKYLVSIQFLYNEATAQLTGTLETPVQIDGTSYPVVRVSPGAGFPIDLAIDPKTGAYVRAVIDPGGSYEETIDIVSYAAPLPGKRVIASYRSHGSHYTQIYSTFQANVPISDVELHPPAQTATWIFANPNPFPIDARGDFILVPATINGVYGTFLLDTGADGIVLMNDFAARAHVRRAASTLMSGIGGTTSAEVDILDSVVVGGNTLSNVTAISAPMGNDYRGVLGGAYNGQRVDGLLGYDLMGGAIVKVNIGASTMTILGPSTANLSGERGIGLNVDLSSSHPMVPMTLDGSISVNAILDTGDALGIGYSRELVGKYHLAVVRVIGRIEGVAGPEITSCGSLGTLQIGPITYVGELACETSALTGTDLLVGIAFLHRFNLVFNYPHGQLILEPLNP